MSVTLQWLLGTAAGITALGVIWTKGVRPAWRGSRRFIKGVAVIADAAPILIEQAQDFRPNAGGSLRDTVDRIDTTLTARGVLFEEIRDEGRELRDVVGVHVEADSAAFARIEAVQALGVETALKVAVALKVETEATAEALKAKTELTASELVTKTEATAEELKTKTDAALQVVEQSRAERDDQRPPAPSGPGLG